MIALALPLLLQSSLVYPDKPVPHWLAEKRGDALVVRRKADTPVAYGYVHPYSPDLVVSCLPDTKMVDVFIHVGVKPSETAFLARFDADPPLSITGVDFDDAQWRRVWGPSTAEGMHELRLAPRLRQAFLAQLIGHRALRIRFTASQQRETTFDLTGLGEAIGPLEEACGLREALAAAHRTVAAAPAATEKPVAAVAPAKAPSQRRVGSWNVIEKASGFDDRPTVVVANTDRTNALTLVLRCQEGRAEAYVKADFVLNPTDKHATAVVFPYGFDAEPLRDVTLQPSQDLTAVFFPDAKAFIAELRTHHTMSVRHQRSGATRSLPATFDLGGLASALETFTRSCPAT